MKLLSFFVLLFALSFATTTNSRLEAADPRAPKSLSTKIAPVRLLANLALW